MPAARSSVTSAPTCRPCSWPCSSQKGAVPFTYDPAKPQDLAIKLNDQASKDVLDYWAGLVKKGLVGTQDQFTPEYISGVVERQVRHLPLGRVGPGLPDRCRRRQGFVQGRVGGCPAAAVGPGQPGRGQLGRLGLRGDHPGEQQASWPPRWPTGSTPTRRRWRRAGRSRSSSRSARPCWTRTGLRQRQVGVLRRPDRPTRRCTSRRPRPTRAWPTPRSRSTTTPSSRQQLAKINAGKTTGDQAADDLQAEIVEYAEETGLHRHRVVRDAA